MRSTMRSAQHDAMHNTQRTMRNAQCAMHNARRTMHSTMHGALTGKADTAQAGRLEYRAVDAHRGAINT